VAEPALDAEPETGAVAPREPLRTPSPAAGLSTLAHGATPAGALHLQRTIGNAATRALLQRRELTFDEQAQNLVSARYAGDKDLEAAYDEDPPLDRGMHNDGVAKIQQGLADEGYAMPKSTKRDGTFDGHFGKETEQIVKTFQARYGQDVTGTVGRQTLAKLDQLAGAFHPGDIFRPRRGPEIEATDEAMGAHVVAGMAKANQKGSPTSGIWYDYNYFDKVQEDPDAWAWKDEWRDGYAPEEYFERIGWMDWRLKPGKSAAAGVKAWLHGLTIAECLSTILALEMDALRAAIGDDAFDARYGSPEESLPDATRLRIYTGAANTPLEKRLYFENVKKGYKPGSWGERNIKVGDRVYFFNHPMYLLKHPGGAWQGENAVYEGRNAEGKQTYSGLGAGGMTEEAMVEEMVKAYNTPRTGADYVWLLQNYAWDAPEVKTPSREFLDHDVAHTKALYEKYKSRVEKKYREDGGVFPDEVTSEKILNAKAYKLGDRTRKGGFLDTSVMRLDAAKVAKLRPQQPPP
jgi:peptidoglycan hydrolase-like protein with peptidoglycan-binding domain